MGREAKSSVSQARAQLPTQKPRVGDARLFGEATMG